MLECSLTNVAYFEPEKALAMKASKPEEPIRGEGPCDRSGSVDPSAAVLLPKSEDTPGCAFSLTHVLCDHFVQT